MAYVITKIGNDYALAKRMTFMIEDEDELETLLIEEPEMAVDSIAKTADYSVYAVLGVDRQWHRLA